MPINKKTEVLIIGKVWPEPDSSAAGSRMMQLIELFNSQGWEITFCSAARQGEFMADLSLYNIKTQYIELNSSSFDPFIEKLDPSIVLFDRFMTEEQFGWRVEEQCPNALRILDTEDLHSLRSARQQAWKEGRQFKNSDLISDVAKREIASIWRCDLSLIISAYEMKLLKDFFKVEPHLLHYLPFMLEKMDDKAFDNLPDYHSRQHFISIGNFLHEPNWNAVLFLKEDIWPIIRKKLPDAELHIYGAYLPQKAEQLHNKKEGFIIKGRAESAQEVVKKARVLLAPLRFGAGLKGKLIQAMPCGTPSVTTQVGAEAMHKNLPWNGHIADDPETIANAAVKLYEDQDEWLKAQPHGRKIINKLYPKEELGEKLLQRIGEVRKDLQSHRENNFTGAMLRHHTAASTKFMSKWIEEKNRDLSDE